MHQTYTLLFTPLTNLDLQERKKNKMLPKLIFTALTLVICFASVFAERDRRQVDYLIKRLETIEKSLGDMKSEQAALESTLQTEIAGVKSSLLLVQSLVTTIHRDTLGLETKLSSLEGKMTKLSSASSPNVQQFAWPALNEDKDTGIIKTVNFEKKSSTSALRVTWTGNVHVGMHSGKQYGCNRWYFTFNARECSNPQPIDAIRFVSGATVDAHQSITVTGLCDNISDGRVQIDFNIGPCPPSKHGELGDAFTGWNQASRIVVEEI